MNCIYSKSIKYHHILYVVGLLLTVFVCSCNIDKKSSGLVISYSESDKPVSTFPYLISKQSEAQILSQVHSTLVSFDRGTGKLKPAIAYDWMCNSDNSRFVLFLRDDIFFHNDPIFGKEQKRNVKAIDIATSLKYFVWSRKKYNRPLSFAQWIVGVDRFFDSCTVDFVPEIPIEGILFSNDYTIVIELYESNPDFLVSLASPDFAILPHEALKQYGESLLVGCGPFYFSEYDIKDDSWILKKNSYYALDSTVYNSPDKVKILFHLSPNKALKMMDEGIVNLIFRLNNSQLNSLIQSNSIIFEQKPSKFLIKQCTSTFNDTTFVIHDSKIQGIDFDNYGIIHFQYVKL